jgi:hypothetical protein
MLQQVADTTCKAQPTLPYRILSVMAQPNPASTPHGFVPGSPLALDTLLSMWDVTQHMETLEINIVQTICKLKMIFPLSFFDLIDNLPIHLPFEEIVGGSVQYRRMYLFERLNITHAS